ncbi:expressed unknown protein [Seminavis robusta]|uniref:Uncharacterized protein n=1 Tax=Seminavis robusta TaxID=568900 RepID=A0A9N8EWH9_9STRA|nr:expressed unknown protein [Seminavis robusta]|eukprot:Sro2249_g320711.1  (322) ;mRNA; f:124-1089
MEAMGVYVLCGFSAFTGIMQSVGLSWESKWPHWTRLAYGAVCFPQPHDPSSLAYYFLVFFPLLFGIPLVYVVYASVTIVRQNLLPPSGRRRALAVYFFRLTVAFLVMWGPCLLFFCITGPFVSTWVYWIGAIWGHLQALVSSVMSLMKPDIWKVYKRFYTQTVWSWCLCGHNGPGDEERRAGSRIRPGMSTAFFMSTMMAPLKDEISPCEGKVRGSRDLRTSCTTGGPSSAFSSTSTPPDMDQARTRTRTRTNKDSSLCSGEALDAIEEGKLGRDGVPRASSSSSTPTTSLAIETRSKGAQPIKGCTGEDLPWECTRHEDV